MERLARALDRTPSLLGRLFTDREQAACRGRPGRLAARFCAKEAVAKAFGTGIREFAFREVEVVNDPRGRPDAVLHGRAVDLADQQGVIRVHLSLSTSRDLAIATAVLETA
jgi:holo-[acyl-carrier protein] synthase